MAEKDFWMWFDIFEKAPFLELSAEVHKTCIDRCISFTRTLYGEQDIKKDKNEAMINQDNPGLTTKLRLYKQNCFGSRNNGYTYKDVLVKKMRNIINLMSIKALLQKEKVMKCWVGQLYLVIKTRHKKVHFNTPKYVNVASITEGVPVLNAALIMTIVRLILHIMMSLWLVQQILIIKTITITGMKQLHKKYTLKVYGD